MEQQRQHQERKEVSLWEERAACRLGRRIQLVCTISLSLFYFLFRARARHSRIKQTNFRRQRGVYVYIYNARECGISSGSRASLYLSRCRLCVYTNAIHVIRTRAPVYTPGEKSVLLIRHALAERARERSKRR